MTPWSIRPCFRERFDDLVEGPADPRRAGRADGARDLAVLRENSARRWSQELEPLATSSTSGTSRRRSRGAERAGRGHDADLRGVNKERAGAIKELEQQIARRRASRSTSCSLHPAERAARERAGRATAPSDNVEVRRARRAAGVRLHAEGALGPRAGARHPRLRARDANVAGARFAVLKGAGAQPRARADQLHARPAHARARLHRGRAAVPGQRRGAHRHRQPAEVRGRPVQDRRRLGSLS